MCTVAGLSCPAQDTSVGALAMARGRRAGVPACALDYAGRRVPRGLDRARHREPVSPRSRSAEPPLTIRPCPTASDKGARRLRRLRVHALTRTQISALLMTSVSRLARGEAPRHAGSPVRGGLPSRPRKRKAIEFDVQMLVDERKQVRTPLSDPAERRSLARPCRSGREFCLCVRANVGLGAFAHVASGGCKRVVLRRPRAISPVSTSRHARSRSATQAR